MPEDIANTHDFITSGENHEIGQSTVPAGSATPAVVDTRTAHIKAPTLPTETYVSADVGNDTIPRVELDIETTEAITAPVVPLAADDTTPSVPSLVPMQGKIALDDATLESLTERIMKGLREAKEAGNNGWAEVNGALKDVDDDKIGSCKEDIDTLLTFAGLFSAALTAFVVESYQSLSPNPTDQMIQLLTQIAVQTNGYTVSPSHVNATSSGPETTLPFEPSRSAVLVNKLWFASLVLALITTPFGILIKQWLTEYRAVSPQHSNIRSRLRIRQFRYPGLLKWRVFEFAALLPLLIQLALGLFLLGLCVFTWSINPSIGRTLTVLVAAWIFFLVASACAPVISAECPYKISLFSRIYPALRSGLTSFWFSNWMYVGPAHEKNRLPWLDLLFFCYIIIPSYASLCHIWYMITRLLNFLTNAYIDKRMPQMTLGKIVWRGHRLPRNARPSPLEEANIATDGSKDLIMLSTVDEILLDDELLSTTMRTVITQDQCRPEDIMLLTRNILGHRLGPLTSPDTFVDLSSLSLRVRDTALNMVAAAIQNHTTLETPGPGVNSPAWAEDALVFLVSLSLQHSITSADITDRVLAFSSLLPKVPGLSPGVLPSTISLQDLAVGLRHYFLIDKILDPIIIGRMHGARYCRPDCRHQSLTAQLSIHNDWASQDDHTVILHLTKDALDESMKQQIVSREVGELLLVAFGPNPYFTHQKNANKIVQHHLARHFIDVLQDAPWSPVRSLLTNIHAPLDIQLLYTITLAYVEELSADLDIAPNFDRPVSAEQLTRFLRLLTFAFARSPDSVVENYSTNRWISVIPGLWNLQCRRFVPAVSLWPQLEELSTELVGFLHLLAKFTERVHRHYAWCKGWQAEIVTAAKLWCNTLDEITLKLPKLQPYVDQVLVPMQSLAAWKPDLNNHLSEPPPYTVSKLSAEEERRAKAAVAMIEQIFHSTSHQEPGPISLADVEAWQDDEAIARRSFEFDPMSQVPSQEAYGVSPVLPKGPGLIQRTFESIHCGWSTMLGTVSPPSKSEDEEAKYELPIESGNLRLLTAISAF